MVCGNPKTVPLWQICAKSFRLEKSKLLAALILIILSSQITPAESFDWRNKNNVDLRSKNENPEESNGIWPFKYMVDTGLQCMKDEANCTSASVDDFPPDGFTPEQREHGALIVHFLLAFYVMTMLAIVCDDYFVPCLNLIAETLKMPPNVAGATIMAIGTSAPELFVNFVGTFVTKGDIGIGTILGSAVFNILAVGAVCGIFAGIVVPLEWWPLTRDCIIYEVAVIALTLVIADDKVQWWEATILVCMYFFYVVLLSMNTRLHVLAKKVVKAFRSEKTNYDLGHTNPLPMGSISSLSGQNAMEKGKDLSESIANKIDEEEEEPEEPVDMFHFPEGSWIKKIFWVIMWPGNMVFFLTIPDVRREGCWKKLYPLAFLMCFLWIGVLTYLVTWFITVIGYTFGAPDSVMGITLLAAGGSVPEAAATLIVARMGKGSMGISNSVGSNSFDIMICLGLPWLIKAAASPTCPDEGSFVVINSGGVVYSAAMLFCTVLLLYFSIALNKFQLDRKIGFILLAGYFAYLILASLFELNVFMTVNLPTCPSDY